MLAKKKALLPLLILFMLVNSLLLIVGKKLDAQGFSRDLLIAANLFFLVLGLLSASIQIRAMNNANPHVFVRSVMSSMLLKMVLCIAAVILYVYASGDAFSKRGIFVALLLYLVYLGVEVAGMVKLNKSKHA